jgi:hypothetical protein
MAETIAGTIASVAAEGQSCDGGWLWIILGAIVLAHVTPRLFAMIWRRRHRP